jgi:hypothetical protein
VVARSLRAADGGRPGPCFTDEASPRGAAWLIAYGAAWLIAYGAAWLIAYGAAWLIAYGAAWHAPPCRPGRWESGPRGSDCCSGHQGGRDPRSPLAFRARRRSRSCRHETVAFMTDGLGASSRLPL